MNRIQSLIENDRRHFLHPSSPIKQVADKGPSAIFEEGHGIYLKDIHGNTYINGTSSLWNVNLGHGRKDLMDAAYKQMEKLEYNSCFNAFSHAPAINLAQKLAHITPENLNVSFFTSSGSEANDTTYKLSRYYWISKGMPDKQKIISRNLAYHGVNIGATSATGLKSFHEMSKPMAPGFLHAPSPDCPNCELGKEYPDCDIACAHAVEELIQSEGSNTVAAMVLEPIQGGGGVIIPPKEYLQRIRKICDRQNVLLIADEIITGFGRTGSMFCVEQYNISPDILILAKGITSAYLPLGAVVLSDDIHQELVKNAPDTLPHGYTYSAHPTCCAVALEAIDILEREHIIDNVKKMEAVVLGVLENIKNDFPIVDNTRAKGLISAIEFKKPDGKNFDKELSVSKKIYQKAFEKGLIIRPIAFASDILAFAPPLIINDQQIRQSGDILNDAIDEVYQELKSGAQI